MSTLYNLVAMTVTGTPGTGDITLNAAATINGVTYLTAAQAGIANNDVVSYSIADTGNSESGTATYVSATTKLTGRTVTNSTNSNAAINATSAAIIRISPRAQDIVTSPACGRLTYTNATTLTFSPCNGSQVKIAGSLYQIPSAGITAANTSVFVNGTGGSNLAASTAYLATLFVNSGTLTFDFISTLTHASDTTSGNIGTEIKSGDNTRTVIGLIRTNGSSQFADSLTQRFVISWFNRRSIGTQNQFTANRNLTTTAAWAEINTEIRIEFLTWADEAVNTTFSGGMFINTAADQMYLGIDFDGTTPPPDIGTFVCQGSNTIIFSVGMSGNVNGLAEGYHYATVMSYSQTGSGGGAVTGTANQARRSGLTVGIRG